MWLWYAAALHKPEHSMHSSADMFAELTCHPCELPVQPPLAAEVKRPIIELCILAIITSSTSLPVVWCAFSLHCHNMPAQGRKVCMSALHVCRVVMQPTIFGLIYPTTSELVGIAWCLLRKTASAVQCCVRRLLLHCILHGCWSAAVGTILQCNTECELGSCDGTCPIACA